MSGVLHRIKSFASLLLLVAVVCIAALSNTASAAPGNPSYCDADVPRLTNQNIGTEVPVIMVHGMGKYSDNATVWGSTGDPSSFAGKVDRVPGVAVAHLFHYDTTIWVDQVSGPKLAKTIDCVSRLSAQNGGKGKVILVGYSMGGLVAREALSRYSTDGQRAVADQVGQVITIGSPHAGADVWTWSVFNPGSPELARLPHFPAQTTVRTIAGDVTKVTRDFWGGQATSEQTHSDTLVSTNSAHSEYSIDVDKGGGQKTIPCEKYFVRLFGASYDTGPASCQHNQLVSHPLNGVHTDTIDAIKKQVAWLNAPPAPQSFTVGAITTTYDSRWKDVGWGAGGAPGWDSVGTDLTNGTPCTSPNCDTTPPLIAYPSILVIDMSKWCTDGRFMMECLTQSQSIHPDSQLGPAPPVTVGGRTPDSSLRFIQSGHTNGSRLLWCFEDEKVCIDYGIGANTYLEPSAALLDVFRTATWSD